MCLCLINVCVALSASDQGPKLILFSLPCQGIALTCKMQHGLPLCLRCNKEGRNGKEREHFFPLRAWPEVVAILVLLSHGQKIVTLFIWPSDKLNILKKKEESQY